MSGNSSRDWLQFELKSFVDTLQPNCLILDAGAGNQMYAPIFNQHRYESADFEKVDKIYSPPTYSCDLSSIPVADGTYDAIVCTQVLEHLPEPLIVLKEFYRLLKPGGAVFLTAPLWYEEHEKPYDFFRYTSYGFRHLFSSAGFDVTDLRWLDGYMASVTHQFRLMKKYLPRHPRDYGGGFHGVMIAGAFLLFRPFIKPLQKAANAADRRFRYDGGGLPKNFVAILNRPRT